MANQKTEANRGVGQSNKGQFGFGRTAADMDVANARAADLEADGVEHDVDAIDGNGHHWLNPEVREGIAALELNEPRYTTSLENRVLETMAVFDRHGYDSMDREQAFTTIAEARNMQYNDVYDAWSATEDMRVKDRDSCLYDGMFGRGPVRTEGGHTGSPNPAVRSKTVVFAEGSGTAKVDGEDWGYKSPVNMTANAKLYQLDGNARPYFSLTADVTSKGGKDLGGGAMGTAITTQFPELDAVRKVHLADDRGWPMHAEANASYWAGGSNMEPTVQYKEDQYPTVEDDLGTWNPKMLARHLRVDEDHAATIRRAAHTHPDGVQAGWAAECSRLAPKWKTEADEALAAIDAFAAKQQS